MPKFPSKNMDVLITEVVFTACSLKTEQSNKMQNTLS